jgi:hypothetical protein
MSMWSINEDPEHQVKFGRVHYVRKIHAVRALRRPRRVGQWSTAELYRKAYHLSHRYSGHGLLMG